MSHVFLSSPTSLTPNPKERLFDHDISIPVLRTPRSATRLSNHSGASDSAAASSSSSSHWQYSAIHHNHNIPDDPIPVSPGGVSPRSGPGISVELPRVTGDGMPCARYETETADEALNLTRTFTSDNTSNSVNSNDNLTLIENQASSAQELMEQRRLYIPLSEVQKVLSRPRQRHGLPNSISVIFKTYLGDSAVDPDVSEWLKLATWWLLKSRIALHAFRQGQDPVCQSMHTRWSSGIPETLAYVDLLKASWIFEEVIAPKASENDQTLLSFTMMKELIMAINQDLVDFSRSPAYSRVMQPGIIQTEGDLRLQDTSDLQLLYPLRRASVPKCQIEFDQCVTVDDVEARPSGWADEHVLFRTFADIQIGINNEPRMRSLGAPYFLVLWTKKGESEMFLSLFDQQRGLDLTHEVTPDDLIRGAEETCQCSTTISLRFDHIYVDVNFLNRQVRNKFISFPISFFDNVREKYKLDHELLLYRSIVRNFKPQYPKKASYPTKVFEFCELRLYETTEDNRWRTTRRLVVSSSANESPNKWWCKSYWMPLSQIHVKSENTQMEISWSDYSCLEVGTDGNYGTLYSMAFRPNEPNNKITVAFRDVQEIVKFRDCLLFPIEDYRSVKVRAKLPLVFDTTTATPDTRIYDINAGDQSYRQVISFAKSNVLQYKSDLFLVYRDLDFEIKPDGHRVDFINLPVPWYTSDMTQLRHKPDRMPTLKEIKKIPRNISLPFSSFELMKIFLKFLTGWELKTLKAVTRLVLSEQKKGAFKKFTCNSTKLKDATLYLWQKVDMTSRHARTSTMTTSMSNSTDSSSSSPKAPRLTMRLHNGPRKWITTSLSAVDIQGMSGNTAELQDLDIRRGNTVDIQNMSASNDTPTGHSRSHSEVHTSPTRWKLEISFRNMDDNLDFLAHLNQMKGAVGS